MIYDVTTKNTSFLELSKYLRQHKIKNNKFMLTLYDETLQGVDPYDPSLTMDQKTRIYTEICTNIWYYIREVARVKTGKPGGVPFKLILGTMAQIYTIGFNLNYILILPRQVGKTVGEIQYILWSSLFASNDSKTLLFNKDFTQSASNLKEYKAMRELLPKWLLNLVKDPADRDNSKGCYYKSNGNSIDVKGSATSADEADKLGRGASAPNIYADEFAFLNHNGVVYNAFYPAWKTSSDNAKKLHAPTGIHITTTPNTLDEGTPGAYMYSMIQAACRFELEMYDVDDLVSFVHNNSSNDYVFIQYGYQDCGKNDEWINSIKREMNISVPANKRKFDREYLLKWTLSNDLSVFSDEQLEKIEQYTHKQPYSIMINNFRILFYEEPDLNKNYIISSDTSNGLGLDSSVLLFVDPDTFAPVGIFKSDTISTATLRRLIEVIMLFYFPNTVLIMENNMSGHSIMEELIRNPAIEQRIYQELREKKMEKTISDTGERVTTKNKRYEYGITTNKANRDTMFEILYDVVENEPEKIVIPELYSEIKTLQMIKGKVQAASGFHDDIVMSYLICRYALAYEKCFRQRFHINPIASSSEDKAFKNIYTNAGSSFIQLMDIANSFQDGQIQNNEAINDYLFQNQPVVSSTDDQDNSSDQVDVNWLFE